MAQIRQFKLPKASVFIVSLVLIVTSLSAEPANYLMDVWTSDNELPDSSVSSIAQTPDGYLWVGTFNGLARFDGVRFVTYDPVTTPQLKNARITGLFVDAWGTLWINTYDGSLTSLRKGVFTHEWEGGRVLSVFSSSNQLLFALAGHHSRLICRTAADTAQGEWRVLPLAGSATGNSIKQDGSGTLWYTVKKDLYRMVDTNSQLMPPATGWQGQSVLCMATGSDGHLWIGTDEGVARWNGGRFEDRTPPNGQTKMIASSLYCTKTGCWVFGDGQVRKCLEGRWVAEVDAKVWRDLVGTFELDLNAYQDCEDGLWFTHLGSGVFHVKPDGTTEHLDTGNGLPSNLASCWFQDREGNVWVGLNRGGLVRLRKKEFQALGPAEGFGAQAVSSLCEDAQSNVWVGTFSGGLYCWRNHQLERLVLPEGAYQECFFSVCPDTQGRLWLSAGREDLYTLEHRQITPANSPVHGIKTILADSQGQIWLGKLNGLSSLSHGVLKNFSSTNNLKDIRALAEDFQGGIWAATDEGNLFHYVDDKFTRLQPGDGQENRPIWSLLPEPDGSLWLGTFRGGLLRFKDGKFSRYTAQDGLPNDIICQLIDDGQGRLWIGSHKGICYVPKKSFADFDAGKIKSLAVVAYGLSDGLPALECSGNYQPACWRGHDGRLWFATVKGSVSIAPGALSNNRLPPPVVIEEILANGQSRALAALTNPCVIAPGERQIEFRYTALSFMAPDKVAFRYQLEGMDEDWVEGGTKRLAHYGRLRPGKYRFHVIACNNDGVWNESGAAMDLVVQPHVWQTWWFECLAAALLLGGVFATVRFAATRKLQRKLAQLKQQQVLDRERERIARDIHDDLGAGLTQIMLQSALARRYPQDLAHLGQISATAHELVGAMDEIVWAINPENDTLDELVTYLGKLVQDYTGQAGLRCRLELPAQVPNRQLTAEMRHHLYLATKETLNNIVKHARATEVGIAFRLEPSGFSFVIKDNGCGFVPGSAKPMVAVGARLASGNGLANLVQRLEKIGGRCVIRSEPGKGTEVVLTVMINHTQ